MLPAEIWITRPSGMVTDLRNPNGLPFLAGMNFTVMLSPAWRAFGPVLPIPLCARAVAEPSAISHPHRVTHPKVRLIIRAPPQNCDPHQMLSRSRRKKPEQLPWSVAPRTRQLHHEKF